MATNPQTNLDVVVRGVDELSPQMKTIESRVIRAVGAVSASLAALRLVSFPVTAAAAFNREMANVTKTTNFTNREIKRLGQELLDLTLKTSASAVDLAKIAAAGGQLGLGREGVEGIKAFTDSVQRMSVVLDLVPEEAATQFGKIKNIFNVNLSDMERVVSAFNQTSNNTTASGKELLDVVRRLGNASGTVNLQQSIGLAASALDFGVSPEVAGTSLSKMFSSLLQRADRFAGLINSTYDGMSKKIVITTKGWVDIVSKDGVAGFKMALDALRKLDANAQQTAIVKLFGGGRIGSLASKYVQDVNNSVIDRDIFQASEGYANGISALREQATVLNTVTEQAKILYNSIEKDAIEAGDQLTDDLMVHIRDLSTSLQQPGVRTFINELVASFGDLINFIADVTSKVAGLNINWDNFIRLAKGLVYLKLGEVMTGLASHFLGLDSQIKKLAVSSAAAGAASSQAGAAGAAAGAEQAAATDKSTSALQRFLAGWREITAIQKQSVTLSREQLAIQTQLAEARAAASSASAAESTGFSRVSRQSSVVDQRSDATNAAALALRSAAKQQMDTELSLRAQYGARVIAAQQKHEAELTEIQLEGDRKRAAARLAGNRKAIEAELAEANTWQGNMLAKEEAHYRRSIQGLERHWNSRITLERANRDAAMVDLENDLKSREAKEQASRERLAAMESNFAGVQGGAAEATEKVVELEQKAAVTGAALETAAARGARTWKGFILLLGTAKNALQAVFAIGMRLFFIGTLVYTLADMVGLIDKLPGWLQKATDWAGLTSKASRDLAIAKAEEAKAHDKVIAKLDESIERYKKLQGETGKYTQQLADVAAGRHKSADVNTASAADKELLDVIEGTKAQMAKNVETIQKAIGDYNSGALQASVDAAKQQQQEALDTQARVREEGEKALERARKSMPKRGPGEALLQSVDERWLESRTAEVAKANEEAANTANKAGEAVAKLQKNLEFAAAAAKGEYLPTMKDLTEEQQAAVKAFASRYTEDTANAFLQQSPAIIVALEAQKRATDDYTKAQEDLASATTAKDKVAETDARRRMEESSAAVTQAGLDLNKARKAMADFANAKAATFADGSLERRAWEDVAQQALNSQEQLEGATTAIKLANQTNMGAADEALKKVGLSLDALASVLGTTKESVLTKLREMVTQAAPILSLFNKDIQEALNNIVKAGGSLFSGATARPKSASATGTAEAEAAANEARAIAKARIKVQNATIEAETALNHERNEQLLAEDDRLYARGLKAMQDYYADRKRVQLEMNADDIAARQRELVEVTEAWKTATKQSEKLQYEAQKIKLTGEIAVLQTHRKAIEDDNAEAARQALQDFKDQFASETSRAFTNLSLNGDINARWNAALDEAMAQYRVWLARLKSETDAAIRANNPEEAQRLQALSEAVTRAARSAAFDAALQGIQAQSEVTYNAMAQYQRRLELLRGEGAITTMEAEAGYSDVIKAQLPLLQQQLEAGEALLQQQQRGTLAYSQQAQAVEAMRLAMRELALEADKTARTINAGIGESLKDALGKLEPTMNSLKNVVIGFLKDVATQIQKQFTDDIAERIMKSVNGQNGAGGIGGVIQKILYPKENLPAAGAGTLPDGSAANKALYVIPIGATAPTTPAGTAQGTGFTSGTMGILGGAAAGASQGGVLGAVLGGISGLGGVMGQDTLQLGATPNNAVWVQVVGGAGGGLPGAGGAGGGTAGLLGGLASSMIGGFFGGAGGAAGQGGAGGTGYGMMMQAPVGQGVNGDKGSGLGQLGDLFTDNTNRSTAAITAAQAAAAASSVASTDGTTGAVNQGTSSTLAGIASSTMSLIMAIISSGNKGGGGGGGSSMGYGIAGMLGSYVGTKAAGAHTGGVLGSTTLRMFSGISPSVFVGASRYHNGGVIGLGPDEIPIIAKRGEEMLKGNDPRHRDNGGLAAGGGAPVQMSQTLVFDTQAAAKAILTGPNLVTAIKPNVKTLRQLLGVK